MRDADVFFRAMDAVSHGRFLRDPDLVLADPRRGGGKPAALEALLNVRKGGVSGVGMAAGASGVLKGVSRSGVGVLGGRGVGGERGMGTAGSGPDGEDWVQCPWLVGMGGFSLAAFLANRWGVMTLPPWWGKGAFVLAWFGRLSTAYDEHVHCNWGRQ